MDTALFALAVFGTVIAVCAASQLDFIKMYRFVERARDHRRGWEWCYLIEHRAHSHAGDMRYGVDVSAYPNLAPNPHYEFYNKPVKVPLPVSKNFIANRAARKTLDKPKFTYEELTGHKVDIAESGGVSYESVRR